MKPNQIPVTREIVDDLMPEPDFDQIALRAVRLVSQHMALAQVAIVEQLRQVWNARPVPRCDGCRFWSIYDKEPELDSRHLGRCDKFENAVSEMMADIRDDDLLVVLASDPQEAGSIYTRADFGCVQWERPVLADAVDPQADSTGTPTTRV